MSTTRLTKRLGWLISITVCCFVFVYFILYTNAGLQLVWRISQRFIPGHIEITQLDGQLARDITFEKLVYTYEGVTTALGRTRVTADWQAVIEGRVHIYHLSCEGVKIQLPKADTSPTHASTYTIDDLFYLLGLIRVDNANVTKIAITQGSLRILAANSVQISRQSDGSNHLIMRSDTGTLEGDLALDFIRFPHWSIQLSGTGFNPALFDSRLNGNLQFTLRSTGDWHHRQKRLIVSIPSLTGHIQSIPVNLTGQVVYNNGTLAISNTHLHYGDADITVNGDLGQTGELRWHARIPELSHFYPAIQGSFNTDGFIQMTPTINTVSITVKGDHLHTPVCHVGQLTGQIHSELTPKAPVNGDIAIHKLHIQDFVFPDISIKLHAEHQQNDLLFQADAKLNNRNYLTAAFRLPVSTTLPTLDNRVSGEIGIHLDDLTLFNQALIKLPQVQSVNGQLDGKIKLDGRLNEPHLNGQLVLSNGSFAMPEYKTTLNHIKVTALYQTGQPIQFQGGFHCGPGAGSLDGTFNPASTQLNLNIKGNNLLVANTSEYQVSASPALQINYRQAAWSLSGSIDVPQAFIMPTDLSSTVSLPSEVVIVNQKKSTLGTPTRLAISLVIRLGDAIRVKYDNLAAGINGQLHITQTPGNLPRATGELQTVNGSYKAYGQTLAIETGRLIYIGNRLTNPGLDIRAIKRVRTLSYSDQSQFSNMPSPVYTGSGATTVGVWIRGTLNKPILNLFSEPAGLNQGDILSYLILGYPQSQASGTSSLSLLSIASSTYSGESSNPVSTLQDKLGLTEFGVGSTDYYDTNTNTTQSATTLNVGKDLGHNLSLHYNVGLFSSVSIFSLRYQISRHFALQSETSSLENGGDLLYQIEAGN